MRQLINMTLMSTVLMVPFANAMEACNDNAAINSVFDGQARLLEDHLDHLKKHSIEDWTLQSMVLR